MTIEEKDQQGEQDTSKDMRKAEEYAARAKTLYHDTLHLLADVRKSRLKSRGECGDNLSVAATRLSRAVDLILCELAENGVFTEGL